MTRRLTGEARVLRRCDELAAITAIPGRIDRYHLTEEHARANALVGRWLRRAGLTTWVDAAGNVCGRLEGREPGLPAVMLGSHLDTVPNAGRYDGPLGVMMAIEVAARLAPDAAGLDCALEVIGFGDEEGARFGTALLGSSPVAGIWHEEWLGLEDDEGVSLEQAFRDFGLDPARVGSAARAPGEVAAYLEAHIEQGPRLEHDGLGLGAVTSIAGARRFHVATLGQARHAGGTPYERRRDALLGASHAVIDVNRIGRARGVIATVGQMQAYPGGMNVVPGKVEFSIDIRAEHDEDRDNAWEEIAEAMYGRCTGIGLQVVVEEAHAAPAVGCAGWLTEAVAAGIVAAGQPRVPRLFSWAGHDAMAIASLTDVGMLFLRCEDGISHHPDEAVLAEDVALGLDAFEATVRDVVRRVGARSSQPS